MIEVGVRAEDPLGWPLVSARIFSTCESIAGPGSMTARRSRSSVLVPGPVIIPGLGAVMRSTRASSRLGSPAVRS